MMRPDDSTLKALLDVSSEAALLVSANGNVLHMNSATRRMLGVDGGATRAGLTDSVNTSTQQGINGDISTYFYFRSGRTLGRGPIRGGGETLSWTDVTCSSSPPPFQVDTRYCDDRRVRRDLEAAGIKANGDRFPVIINLVRVGDADPNQQNGDDDLYCVYAQDLTPIHRQQQSRIKELEKQVLQLSRKNDALLEASSEDAVVIDSRGIIQLVCQSLLDDLGYRDKGDVLGNHISLLVDDKLAPKNGYYTKQFLERREVEARQKNGTKVVYEIGMAEIRCDIDEEQLIIVMMRNISREKSAQNKQLLAERIRRGVRERSLILDASFDPMFSISETGIIFMVNQAAVDQFGWSREEFIGSNISMIVGGEHQQRHDEYIARYLRTGEKRVMGKKRELLAKRKDGSEFIIELGLTEVKTPVGEERMFCGFIKDLTRQKEDEMELKRKQQVTLSILEASFDAMFHINESGVIQMVNQAAVNQFGWRREEFLGKNISMIVGGNHAANHDAYIARYLKTGEKHVMGKKRELLARRKDGSEFTIELGLTEVDTESGDERMFCGFIKDLSRQKQDEMELQRKQSITMGIIEASFDALFRINERGIIQMVNQAAINQFGWSREEFIGSNINMIVGGQHAEKHDNYIARYLETGEKHVMGKKRELPARRKDGSEFPVELGLAEIKTESGDDRMFCGFIKDISRQKKDEMELKRKQSFTMGILEASFDAMFRINERGIIQMVNQAAVSQFGWSRDQLIGSNISMIVGGHHPENHDEYIARYLQTGEKRVMGKKRELPARRKDGSEFPIELGLTEITTETGEDRTFCGFIKDLSRQKKDELELKRKQSVTVGILETSFDAMFCINEQGIIQIVNEAAVRQFGYSRDEFIGSNIVIVFGSHNPEDREEFLSHYLKVGEVQFSGDKRELSARRKDGSVFTVEIGLAEIKTESGDDRMFCTFIKDLSRLKDAEAESRRKNNITMGILDASFDAVFQIDERGMIQMVNKAATAQFGWSKEEFLGRNISMIAGGIHAQRHNDYIAHYLQTDERRAMGKKRRLPARRKDGSEFTIELGLSEVDTELGEGRMFCGFIKEIEEERRTGFDEEVMHQNGR